MTNRSASMSAASLTTSRTGCGQEVGVKLEVCPFGHFLRALENPTKAPGGPAGVLPDFLDELGQVIDLHDRDHVQL
jgi:hypothetical protein